MTRAAAGLLVAEGESEGIALPLEPWAFGLAAFVLLGLLLAVTLAFGKDR